MSETRGRPLAHPTAAVGVVTNGTPGRRSLGDHNMPKCCVTICNGD